MSVSIRKHGDHTIIASNILSMLGVDPESVGVHNYSLIKLTPDETIDDLTQALLQQPEWLEKLLADKGVEGLLVFCDMLLSASCEGCDYLSGDDAFILAKSQYDKLTPADWCIQLRQ